MGFDGFHNLVKCAQEGDRQAMDRVLEIIRPHVEPFARPYADPARPVESTSDMLQEACLRAWNKIGSFEGNSDDEECFRMFRAWIGQVVRTVGANAQRDRQRQRRTPPGKVLRLHTWKTGTTTGAGSGLEPPAEDIHASEWARTREGEDRLRAALARLPDDSSREILRLHIFDGVSLKEIAGRLDLTYHQVRRRYWATLDHLKEELKGLL